MQKIPKMELIKKFNLHLLLMFGIVIIPFYSLNAQCQTDSCNEISVLLTPFYKLAPNLNETYCYDFRLTMAFPEYQLIIKSKEKVLVDEYIHKVHHVDDFVQNICLPAVDLLENNSFCLKVEIVYREVDRYCMVIQLPRCVAMCSVLHNFFPNDAKVSFNQVPFYEFRGKKYYNYAWVSFR